MRYHTNTLKDLQQEKLKHGVIALIEKGTLQLSQLFQMIQTTKI